MKWGTKKKNESNHFTFDEWGMLSEEINYQNVLINEKDQRLFAIYKMGSYVRQKNKKSG